MMMEMVVTTGAIRRTKLQSNRHHQQTNTQLSAGRMPFLLPNQQCQSIEGNSSSQDLYTELSGTSHCQSAATSEVVKCRCSGL